MLRRKTMFVLRGVAVAALMVSAHAQFVQIGSKLIGSGAIGPADQGASVALSADGNTAAVGGVGDNGNIGAVWIWIRNAGVWTQQAKLVGSGGSPNGLEGWSVAISADGNTVIEGGYHDNFGTGAARIWVRSGTTWSEQAKLVGTGGPSFPDQGYSVGLSADGNTAIVGGRGVWIWVRNNGVWTQQGPSLLGSGQGNALDDLSVAISGDGNTAIAGDQADNNYAGAVWMWTRSFGVWTQQSPKLLGTGALGNPGLGQSVALSADGNTAIAGAMYDNGLAGAAWVWTRSNGVWTQQGPKLVGSGISGLAEQGYSVALTPDGNTAMVAGVVDNQNVGAVWAWTRHNGVWAQLGPKIVGSGTIPPSSLGAVALSSDGLTAAVGGPTDNNYIGAIWIFIQGPPVVTSDPSNVTFSGFPSQVSFSAAASGTPTPTVQWQLSTNGGTTFTDIPGATSNTYVLSHPMQADTGKQFRAVFTSATGVARSKAATLTFAYPIASLSKTHSGTFTQGQPANWNFVVSNVGSGDTGGYPTVITDTLPAGYTFSSFSGSGWTCSGTTTVYCASNATMAAGASLPALTLTVNVPSTSPASAQNTASVTGTLFLSSATATDTVNVVPPVVFGTAAYVQQGQKLVGSGYIGSTVTQGSSVAISTDGNTALVGGLNDNQGQGGVWAWTRSGGVWTQQGSKLVGSGGIASPESGYAVALSEYGDTAIVGGAGDNAGVGAAWIWTRSAGVWTQQGPKLVGTGSAGTPLQGATVALSADGNTALVGGYNDNNGIGAVWVWTRTNGVWTQQGSKLVGTGYSGNPNQGFSLALSWDGNTALVGGPQDSIHGGDVWVWTRSGGLWTQQALLLVPGIPNYTLQQAGWSVALSANGNTALVGGLSDNGNIGAAWIWTRTNGTWSLQGSKLVGTGYAGSSQQGASVALSAQGNTAVIAGIQDTGNAGALWVWTSLDGVWTQQGPKVIATGETAGAELGHSLAISGDGQTILAGGPYDNGNIGAAWVFNALPIIVTTNPVDQEVVAGSPATFRVGVRGAPQPTIQWQVSKNNGLSYGDVAGANSTVYSLNTSYYDHGSLYRASFLNGYSNVTAVSTAARLLVDYSVLSLQVAHGPYFTQGQQNAIYQLTVSNRLGSAPTNGLVEVSVTLPQSMTIVSIGGAGWSCETQYTYCTRTDSLSVGANYPIITVTVNVARNASSPQYTSFWIPGGGGPSTTTTDSVIIQNAPVGLGFFPVTPCRMVDTRGSQGKVGAFGAPALSAYSGRDFPLLSSGCGIAASAQAYSLNFTAVPRGVLDFLSAWPSGQVYPGVSTLNSPDGNVLANAAIVPGGTNGAVAVVSGKPTDLIIDTNGYFAPPNGQELAFYPIAPCRVVDTRPDQNKSGLFGPPNLKGYVARDFPISSSLCGIPRSALAYSLNMTAVPDGGLDFLSTWPAGEKYPGVSTLNSTDGSVLANAAIVPAGITGGITVMSSDATDLIIDANGYFAPPGGAGALHFYAVTPCRIADTRAGQGKSGAFGPPSLGAYSTRDIPMLSSACGIPTNAQAYSLNLTAVPLGPLGFLSAWPTGQSFPGVSTLNSPKGTVIANAAIVPAGVNGAITVMAGNPTDLIIDISGYFAP